MATLDWAAVEQAEERLEQDCARLWADLEPLLAMGWRPGKSQRYTLFRGGAEAGTPRHWDKLRVCQHGERALILATRTRPDGAPGVGTIGVNFEFRSAEEAMATVARG